MRSIKFRAWEPIRKEMVYFDNKKAAKDQFIAANLLSLMSNTHHAGKDLLMQYTGLKDRDGKEIYEDDIYTWPAGTKIEPESGVVKFSNGCFRCVSSSDSFTVVGPVTCIDIMAKGLEIIGNIHQNPELIAKG